LVLRDVALDISLIGLNVGDGVTLTLVDSMGNQYTRSSDGYTINETITLDSPLFTKELLENEALEALTHYKLTLESGIYYNFELHLSDSSKEPHDLYPLLSFGCIASILNKYTQKLENDFVKKLDIYFSGGEPHFNVRQQDVVTLYEYYANSVIDTNYTIDIIRIIDEYLSTLQEGDIV